MGAPIPTNFVPDVAGISGNPQPPSVPAGAGAASRGQGHFIEAAEVLKGLRQGYLAEHARQYDELTNQYNLSRVQYDALTQQINNLDPNSPGADVIRANLETARSQAAAGMNETYEKLTKFGGGGKGKGGKGSDPEHQTKLQKLGSDIKNILLPSENVLGSQFPQLPGPPKPPGVTPQFPATPAPQVGPAGAPIG